MMLALHDNATGVSVCDSMILDLRFADDISFLADSDLNLQLLVDKVVRPVSGLDYKSAAPKLKFRLFLKDTSQVMRSMRM